MTGKAQGAQYPTQSSLAEEAVIRIAIEDPKQHFQGLVSLGSSAFVAHHGLVTDLIRFWRSTKKEPDPVAFQVWCKDPVMVENLDRVMSSRKKINHTGFQVYVEELGQARLGRGLADLAKYLADRITSYPHPEILSNAQSRLQELQQLSSIRAQRTRNYYWEMAPERWRRFERIEKNPDQLRGIPFGMQEIDELTGGLHVFEGEADVVAIFGPPGSQKSRLMLNMAYNQASSNIPVMVISREMAATRVNLLLDSRESLRSDIRGGTERLEYKLLQDAYLTGRYRERYKALLATVNKHRRYPLWVVDCPEIINTADIVYEIEYFKSSTGSYPQVIYLDYANLVNPVGDYSNKSEHLDTLFVELLGIMKSYSIPLVTAVRESRTGSLTKERDEVDMQHVGMSQAISYHVHQLWHLDQTKEDRAQNRLMVRFKKNRYGELANVALFTAPRYAYIGDRDVEASADAFADVDEVVDNDLELE